MPSIFGPSQFENEAIISNQKDPHLDLTRTVVDGRFRLTSSISTVAGEIPFWGDAPLAWDTVVIGRTLLPGIARITGAVKRRVDRKKAVGKHGHTVTYLGDDAAEFSIALMLWTSDHLQKFHDLVTFLKSLKPEKAAGINADQKISARVANVYHPALSIYGITLAHVLEYGMPEPDGDDGKYRVVLKCLEYIPVRDSGVSTPKTTTGDVGTLKKAGILNPKPSANNAPDPNLAARK